MLSFFSTLSRDVYRPFGVPFRQGNLTADRARAGALANLSRHANAYLLGGFFSLLKASFQQAKTLLSSYDGCMSSRKMYRLCPRRPAWLASPKIGFFPDASLLLPLVGNCGRKHCGGKLGSKGGKGRGEDSDRDLIL